MADARPFHWEYHPEPVAREVFRIEGGRPLNGTVPISGAKNAALKLFAAATLTGERCRLTNVPEIEDVRVMAETLRDLGVVVDHPTDNVYEIASGDVEWLFVPLEAAARMRASFMLLGPLLARFGRVIISNPGGDRIGRRPVNLHVEAMQALGATISYRNGYYFATAPGRLRGTEVRFPFVSVMGTENAMLAATLAEGHTVIRPAAREPEVDDLIEFLVKMGAEVERTYPDTIEVEASDASAARSTTSSPIGSRPGPSWSPARSPAGSSDWRTRPATTSQRSSRPCSASASASSAGPTPSTSTAPPVSTAAIAPATSRPPRIRVSPRTSSRQRPSC